VGAGGGPRGDLAEERVTSRYNLAKTGCWCLGQALFTIVSAVAQLERDLIRERVSAGIRNARANGKKLGRPRVKANLEEILQLKAEGHSLRKIAAKLGIGDGTVRDRLKDQRGKPHAKGPS
jgi:DNA invertase Pin-like site-specific DNA recombinase